MHTPEITIKIELSDAKDELSGQQHNDLLNTSRSVNTRMYSGINSAKSPALLTQNCIAGIIPRSLPAL